MRIAVITFFQSKDNYGQVLQCYALQKVLRGMGHSPYLIRYGFHQKYFHWLKKANYTTKQGRKRTYNRIKEIVSPPRVLDRGFVLFKRKNLVQSLRCYNTLAELQRKPPRADCYIAGSDQVWAQLLSKNDNRSFFLDFGPDNVKRIAYAASFAVDDYPNELKAALFEQLKKFDAISVRESSGVRICNSIGYSAKLVLDPTLLHSASFYERIAKKPQLSHYCFVYHVNVNTQEELYWDVFSEFNFRKGIQSIACFANPVRGKQMEFISGSKYVYPSIEEWLGFILCSEYVLTSSFHGIVFSVLFHKPFVICLRQAGLFAGNDRVMTLLSTLHLEARVMRDSMSADSILSETIDWDAVDSILARERVESIGFLEMNLSDEGTL